MQPGPERLLVLAERMEIPWAWSADAPPAGWRPWHRPRARGAGVSGLDRVIEDLTAARRAPRIARSQAETTTFCPYYAARWWSAAAAYAAEQAEDDTVRRFEQKQELAADAAGLEKLVAALTARLADVGFIAEHLRKATDVGDAGFVGGLNAGQRAQRVARLLKELRQEAVELGGDLARARAPLVNNPPKTGVRTFAFHAARAFGQLTASTPKATGRCIDFVRAAAIAAGVGDGSTSWEKTTAAALDENAAGVARYDIFAASYGGELIETSRKTTKVPPTRPRIRAG